MLVRGGRPAADPFIAVADDQPLPDGPAVVSLRRFLAEREHLAGRGHLIGVRVETAESPTVLADFIDEIALIVLHVPYFKDGRAFSWARLLRTRMAFRGEIRLTGHILKDQLAFYTRVGVDAFELTQNIPVAEIEAALREISQVYQPSVDGRVTIPGLRAARQPATR